MELAIIKPPPDPLRPPETDEMRNLRVLAKRSSATIQRLTDERFDYKDVYVNRVVISPKDTKFRVVRADLAGKNGRAPTGCVAVKVKKLDASNPMEAAITVQEVECMEKLSGRHPNIVRMRRAIVNIHNDLFIEMDYYPSTLYEVMCKKEVVYTCQWVQALARQLLSAVEFCHANYIMHADIKAGNILVAADGTIRLADFDVSRTAHPKWLFQASHSVNSVPYRAPETLLQLEHRFEPDIWAVGCTLATLLCDGCVEVSFLYPEYQRQMDFIHQFGGPLPAWYLNRNANPDIRPHYPATNVPEGFDAVFDHINVHIRRLMERMLVPVHTDRPSATTLLAHPFFYYTFEGDVLVPPAIK
jgi:serine/threonine protein kinase